MSLEKYYEVLARYHNILTASDKLTEGRRLKILEWSAVARGRFQ